MAAIFNGFVMVVNGGFGEGFFCWPMKTDSGGTLVWTNQFGDHPYFTGRWIAPRETPHDGFVMVGRNDRDISMTFLDSLGTVTGEGTWTIVEFPNRTDIAEHATPTPDGGYLLVGSADFPTHGTFGSQYELALLKTDAEGNDHWLDVWLGISNWNEYGVAAVALTNGSYVILGRRNVQDEGPVWLFRLAANHPPIAKASLLPIIAFAGEPVPWNGTNSLDMDGTVVLHEWDFDDGTTSTGAVVNHTFAESGLYEVRLTAVDDDDGEDVDIRPIFIMGVRVESDLHFTIPTGPPLDMPRPPATRRPT